MKKIKLPDLEQFFVKDKHHSPYVYLYDWMFRSIQPLGDTLYSTGTPLSCIPSDSNLDVTKVVWTEVDDKKFDAIVKKWLKYTKHRQSNIHLLKLGEGPSTFRDGQDLEEGYLYVKEDFLIPKR